MAKSIDTDDESFIVIGASMTNSVDSKFSSVSDTPTQRDIEDALKDLPMEASMALKAHFKMSDGPSPTSLMVASTIVTDEKTPEHLQRKFGEILDENTILKETLKQNNESLREQYMLIVSCQEDMMHTHQLHKDKFDETKDLIERLRRENKHLKSEVARLSVEAAPKAKSDMSASMSDMSASKSVNKPDGKLNVEEVRGGKLDGKLDAESNGVPVGKLDGVSDGPSGGSSLIEFVSSPDDDMIHKLTAQLELVERQRRQVIMDNEKLVWQKESLESVVDSTSRERDALNIRLTKMELDSSKEKADLLDEISRLKLTVADLEGKLNDKAYAELSVRQLQARVQAADSELQVARAGLAQLEKEKAEYLEQKQWQSDLVREYKTQIQDLQARLRETQATVFQPVRPSLSAAADAGGAGGARLAVHVALYDRTLKHLGQLLNALMNDTSDNLIQVLCAMTSVLEARGAPHALARLADVKTALERQHSAALGNIGHIKGTVSIFEDIFKDYRELATATGGSAAATGGSTTSSVESLTAGLLARGMELTAARAEAAALRADDQLLRAQLDVYKCDFEAERESRQRMAAEKESVAADLRAAQRAVRDLTEQLQEIRNIDPSVFTRAAKRTAPPAPPAPRAPRAGASATGNTVYTCPKCMRFSSDQYSVMEDHFNYCLDDF